MRVVAVGDRQPEPAVRALVDSGYAEDRIEICDTSAQARRAMEAGKAAVLLDAARLAELPVDAVCDVTGDPIFGAEIAFRTIQEGKHMVVVNIESDVGIGPLLSREAARAGVIYTGADGDQPSLIQGLVEWSRCLGLEVQVAGKWTTMHPPEDYDQSDRRTDLGYLDGSKNQVEMCCVANMTGLLPDRRGMHHPNVALLDMPNLFATREEGGILSQYGIVDCVNSMLPDRSIREAHLGGGVFVQVTGANPDFLKVLRSKHVIHSTDGKRGLLYRPYHLVGIEAPMTILRAVLYGEATAAPLPAPVADVVAIAKRDLQPGDRLDGIGGRMVRGEMERFEPARAGGLLPLCLAENVRVKCAVAKGETLTYGMLEAEGRDFMWRLRRLQDNLLG